MIVIDEFLQVHSLRSPWFHVPRFRSEIVLTSFIQLVRPVLGRTPRQDAREARQDKEKALRQRDAAEDARPLEWDRETAEE